MPSIDSEVKTARMNAETWGIVSRSMEEEGITFSAWVKKMAHGSVHTSEREEKPHNDEGVPKGAIQEIGEMCGFFGISPEEFFREIQNAMIQGQITYEDGVKFHGVEDVDLRKFKEACDSKGVPYQKMIDKAAQMVWQS